MRGRRRLASRGGHVKSFLQVLGGEASRSRQMGEKLCVKASGWRRHLLVSGASVPQSPGRQCQWQSHCGGTTVPISQGDPEIGEACNALARAAVMHCNSIRVPASRFALAAARGGVGRRAPKRARV